MKPHIKVKINAGTIAAMTDEQFRSLRDNICAEGHWETADGLEVSGGGDYIGVSPMMVIPDMAKMRRIIFIGIEKDGYTHS
jgi:hypothetical protein